MLWSLYREINSGESRNDFLIFFYHINSSALSNLTWHWYHLLVSFYWYLILAIIINDQFKYFLDFIVQTINHFLVMKNTIHFTFAIWKGSLIFIHRSQRLLYIVILKKSHPVQFQCNSIKNKTYRKINQWYHV